MTKFFQKIPLLLSIVLFIFSCLVFFYFYGQIENKNQQSQISESAWHREVLRRDELKTLDRSVKVIADERVQLETHFAQSSNIVPFLDTIEGLGKDVFVKAEVTSVSILEDHSGLSVGMKAAGTFDGLYKFLTLLENSPYEIEFTSLDLQKESGVDVSGKNTSAPNWNAVFNMKLLSFIN